MWFMYRVFRIGSIVTEKEVVYYKARCGFWLTQIGLAISGIPMENYCDEPIICELLQCGYGWGT